jgi:hypothetical protein
VEATSGTICASCGTTFYIPNGTDKCGLCNRSGGETLKRIQSDPVAAVMAAMELPPKRDPQTCAWRPCGWLPCAEHGDPTCEHRTLAKHAIEAALNAHVNDMVDQAREDKWDGDEDRAADDRCGGAW